MLGTDASAAPKIVDANGILVGPRIGTEAFARKRRRPAKNKVWIAYFAVAFANFAALAVFSKRYAHHCMIRDEPSFYIFMLTTYFFICLMVTASRKLISQESVTGGGPSASARSFCFSLLLDALFLATCGFMMKYESYVAGVAICLPFLQKTLIVGHLLSYIAPAVSKEPLAILSSVMNIIRRYDGFQLLVIMHHLASFLFIVAFSTLLYVSILTTKLVPALLHFAGTCAFSLWVFYSSVVFQRVYITAAVYRSVTSPSNNFVGRNLISALKTSSRMLGTILYLGMLLTAFSGVSLARALVFYSAWNPRLRYATDALLAWTFPSAAPIYRIGVSTVIPFVAIFEVDPADAVDLCRHTISTMDREIDGIFRSAAYQRVSPLFSAVLFVAILAPLSTLMLFDVAFSLPVFLKTFALMAWGSIEFPSFMYIASDAIHKTLILCFSKDLAIDHPLVSDYIEEMMGF